METSGLPSSGATSTRATPTRDSVFTESTRPSHFTTQYAAEGGAVTLGAPASAAAAVIAGNSLEAHIDSTYAAGLSTLFCAEALSAPIGLTVHGGEHAAS